ncbi:MAG TPA: pitrilysin family protein [Chthonomonadales bacterium]|nr:pitrilysin family protein [Chthonomonadales bacterium]
MENIQTSTLANGVRVVSETVPHVESISIGIWVGVGSRDEDRPVRGITHFIEHMLFKGTERRNARQIAEEIESRGGSLNAFTDKEYTCYYAKALAEHAEVVIDVLSDMLCHSVLDPVELEREKNVVLEEIKRYRDTPDDMIHDVFAQTVWNTHPLGRPIIGTDRTVAGLQRENLTEYIRTHYTPDKIVVAAAGNVPHEQIVTLAEQYLGHLSGNTGTRRMRPPHASGQSRTIRKRTEQVHFCMGGQGYSQQDDERYVLTIIDSVLGGNMSSRLFQEIREKRGLAYAIGSYSIAYQESGLFAIYGGTSPETFAQVVDLTRAEIEKVKRHNLTEEEVQKAKTQIRGALVLGLESMSNRMMRMGKSMIYFGRVIPLEEIIGKINTVTHDDIARVANHIFDERNLSLAAVGPLGKSD